MFARKGLSTVLRLAAPFAISICPLATLAQPSPLAPPFQPTPPMVAGPPGRELTQAERDPVVGSVDGRLIYLSDLGRSTRELPDDQRGLPFETLMPALIERMVDHTVLSIAARRAGLDKRPDVQRDMRAAAEAVLESAYLATLIPAQTDDAAVEARYNLLYANRPPADQVRARHILVGTEAEANAIIQDLKKGRDFATIARARSKDPDGATGGDLGFFNREQVSANFADAAFGLQPGQISQTPVQNEFGWHVLKVEERRLLAPPTLSEIRETLRKQLAEIATVKLLAEARNRVIVHRFNLDGTEMDPNLRLRVPMPDGR